MNLNPTEKNAFEATNMLLYLSKVRVTARSLRNALWQHPDFPSLSALSDVLTDFNIPNMATRLTPDRLSEIPLPALVHLQIDGGVFVPVRKVGSTVEWLDTKRGWQSDTYNDFVHKWTGVTLLIEANETSGEREYAQNRRREWLNSLRIPFIVSVMMICLGVILWSLLKKFSFASHFFYYSLLATKLVGTVVSGMLVWYGIDAQNSFLQKVCRLNRRSNCQNILHSPAAKVNDWLNWSEVGLFYFVGTLTALIIGMWTGSGKQLTALHTALFTLTTLSLPYTFWSVYYQWRVAQEWCVLCLTVQLLLWLELGIGITEFSVSNFPDEGKPLKSYEFSVNSFLYLLLYFSIMPMIWAFLKGHLQKSLGYDILYRDFQKIKFDSGYVQSLFRKERLLPPIFEGMKVIEIGNSEAEHTLTLISSPTCASCRRNHLALMKLLQKTDKLKCQVILAANPNSEASKIVLQILGLPSNRMAEVLHSWFESKAHGWEQWKSNIEENSDIAEAALQFDRHIHWLHLAGIQTAPQTFLNSVELPKFYNIAEITKLLELSSKEGFIQIK